MSGCPGYAETRSKIQVAADVALVLVAQTVANCQIRPKLPVVLGKSAEIKLVNRSQWVAGGDRKLRGAAALQADICAGQSCSQALLGNLKSLNAGKAFGVCQVPRA